MKTKKILSLILALSMILAVVPSFGIVASAAEEKILFDASTQNITGTGDASTDMVHFGWTAGGNATQGNNSNLRFGKNWTNSGDNGSAYPGLTFFDSYSDSTNRTLIATKDGAEVTSGADSVTIDFRYGVRTNKGNNYQEWSFKDLDGNTIAQLYVDAGDNDNAKFTVGLDKAHTVVSGRSNRHAMMGNPFRIVIAKDGSEFKTTYYIDKEKNGNYTEEYSETISNFNGFKSIEAWIGGYSDQWACMGMLDLKIAYTITPTIVTVNYVDEKGNAMPGMAAKELTSAVGAVLNLNSEDIAPHFVKTADGKFYARKDYAPYTVQEGSQTVAVEYQEADEVAAAKTAGLEWFAAEFTLGGTGFGYADIEIKDQSGISFTDFVYAGENDGIYPEDRGGKDPVKENVKIRGTHWTSGTTKMRVAVRKTGSDSYNVRYTLIDAQGHSGEFLIGDFDYEGTVNGIAEASAWVKTNGGATPAYTDATYYGVVPESAVELTVKGVDENGATLVDFGMVTVMSGEEYTFTTAPETITSADYSTYYKVDSSTTTIIPSEESNVLNIKYDEIQFAAADGIPAVDEELMVDGRIYKVTDATNRVPNPSFETADGDYSKLGWYAGTSDGNVEGKTTNGVAWTDQGYDWDSTENPISGNHAFGTTWGDPWGGSCAFLTNFKVNKGKTYYFSFYLRKDIADDTDSQAAFNLGYSTGAVVNRDEATTFPVTETSLAGLTQGEWTKFERIITIPEELETPYVTFITRKVTKHGNANAHGHSYDNFVLIEVEEDTEATKTIVATYTVDGAVVNTVKKTVMKAQSAEFEAYTYAPDGGNAIYTAEAATLSESAEIPMTKLANPDVAGLANGQTATVDGRKYNIISGNLIPNGDFSSGYAGWFAHQGTENASDAGFTINSDGTLTVNGGGGAGSSNGLSRNFAIGSGKTYLFTSYTETDNEWNCFNLTKTLNVEENRLLGSGAAANSAGQGMFVFTNTDNYNYAQIMYRYNNGKKIGNFGLYEVEPITSNYTITITGAGENSGTYTKEYASDADAAVPEYFPGYVLKTRTINGTTITFTYEENKETLGTWAIRNNMKGGDKWISEMRFLGTHDSFTSNMKGDNAHRDYAGYYYGSVGGKYTSHILNSGSMKDQGAVYAYNNPASSAVLNRSKAQSMDALEQLNAGVRYFDVRLSRQQDGTFWTRHGLLSDNFEDVAYTIAQFAKENPGEVIVLDFQSLYDALYTEVVDNTTYNGDSIGDDNAAAYAALVELLQRTGLADFIPANRDQKWAAMTKDGSKAAIIALCKARGANCQPTWFENRSTRYGNNNIGYIYTDNDSFSTVLNYIDNNYTNIVDSGFYFGAINAYTTPQGINATNTLINDAKTNNPNVLSHDKFTDWFKNETHATFLIFDGMTADFAAQALAKMQEFNRDGYEGTYTNEISGVKVEGPTANVPFSTALSISAADSTAETVMIGDDLYTPVKEYDLALTQFSATDSDVTGAVNVTFPSVGGEDNNTAVLKPNGESYEVVASAHGDVTAELNSLGKYVVASVAAGKISLPINYTANGTVVYTKTEDYIIGSTQTVACGIRDDNGNIDRKYIIIGTDGNKYIADDDVTVTINEGMEAINVPVTIVGDVFTWRAGAIYAGYLDDDKVYPGVSNFAAFNWGKEQDSVDRVGVAILDLNKAENVYKYVLDATVARSYGDYTAELYIVSKEVYDAVDLTDASALSDLFKTGAKKVATIPHNKYTEEIVLDRAAVEAAIGSSGKVVLLGTATNGLYGLSGENMKITPMQAKAPAIEASLGWQAGGKNFALVFGNAGEKAAGLTYGITFAGKDGKGTPADYTFEGDLKIGVKTKNTNRVYTVTPWTKIDGVEKAILGTAKETSVYDLVTLALVELGEEAMPAYKVQFVNKVLNDGGIYLVKKDGSFALTEETARIFEIKAQSETTVTIAVKSGLSDKISISSDMLGKDSDGNSITVNIPVDIADGEMFMLEAVEIEFVPVEVIENDVNSDVEIDIDFSTVL